MNPTDLAPSVESLLRATRGDVLAAFAQPPAGRRKADGSIVTDLDLQLEERIGAGLLALDPRFGLFSEEGGLLREGTPCWHLDPVDGTANFARRNSLFASQVVLMDGTTPLLGAIYEPLRDDYTWAAPGAGAWREGQRLTVADPPASRAVLYADLADTGLFIEHAELLLRLRCAVYKLRLLGSIAIHLRDVAAGVADAYLSGRGQPSALHDVAPGILICREAGVRTSDGAGGDPLVDRDTILAATPRVHDRIAGILAELR